MILTGNGEKEIRAKIGDEAYRNLPKAIGGECTCMPESEVPKHGMACMLGHAHSVAFIQHMKRRNDEAGIANSYTPIAPEAIKDQEEEKAGIIETDPQQPNEEMPEDK